MASYFRHYQCEASQSFTFLAFDGWKVSDLRYHGGGAWEKMASERQHRLAIVEFGRLLHSNGFVAATDGNLSVRLDERRLLVTPTYMSKGRMRASDLVIVDYDGNRLAGKRNVSSEIGMHLLIYRLRPDVQGIVHAHPPTATGFAASGMDLNQPLVCEVVVGLGEIPLARYGTPAAPERPGTRAAGSTMMHS
jgi:L-fuculose-phosphate aldolase